MRTVRIKLFKFDELSEEAKKNAIQEFNTINVDYEWWDSTYEDAERIGLKISSFDIDRDCTGDFIEDAVYTANKIKEEHGEECETYKTAEAFLKERDELIDTWPKDEDGDFENEGDLDEKLDEIEGEFLKSILEDYRILLRKEHEYRISEEAIIEAIKGNEYEFTKEGKQY